MENIKISTVLNYSRSYIANEINKKTLYNLILWSS